MCCLQETLKVLGHMQAEGQKRDGKRYSMQMETK